MTEFVKLYIFPILNVFPHYPAYFSKVAREICADRDASDASFELSPRRRPASLAIRSKDRGKFDELVQNLDVEISTSPFTFLVQVAPQSVVEGLVLNSKVKGFGAGLKYGEDYMMAKDESCDRGDASGEFRFSRRSHLNRFITLMPKGAATMLEAKVTLGPDRPLTLKSASKETTAGQTVLFLDEWKPKIEALRRYRPG